MVVIVTGEDMSSQKLNELKKKKKQLRLKLDKLKKQIEEETIRVCNHYYVVRYWYDGGGNDYEDEKCKKCGHIKL